jgi:hypothetical protein
MKGSFARGFRNRSPLVLLAAAGLLGPALLGVQYLFAGGAWSHVPLKYWVRKSSDDYTYVSWTVGRLRQDPPHVAAVYLLGGSAARESITSGASLSRDIVREGGPVTVAYDLGSPNQNFAQSLVIADNVPARDAWVLIGVGPGRFETDRGASYRQTEGRELLLASGSLQRYVARRYGRYKYAYTILPGVFSYLAGFVQERETRLLSGGVLVPVYTQHRYNQKGAHSVAEKERMVRIWNKRRYPQFHRHLRFNMDLLEQLLARCARRGLHAVLVELPCDRALIGARFDYAVAQYQAPVAALSAGYGVPYLDFNAALDLPDIDFHDLSHLTETGRVAWQRALAQQLARLMSAEAAGSSRPVATVSSTGSSR